MKWLNYINNFISNWMLIFAILIPSFLFIAIHIQRKDYFGVIITLGMMFLFVKRWVELLEIEKEHKRTKLRVRDGR